MESELEERLVVVQRSVTQSSLRMSACSRRAATRCFKSAGSTLTDGFDTRVVINNAASSLPSFSLPSLLFFIDSPKGSHEAPGGAEWTAPSPQVKGRPLLTQRAGETGIIHDLSPGLSLSYAVT